MSSATGLKRLSLVIVAVFAAGIAALVADSTLIPTAKTAATTRLSRLRPVAEDTRYSGQRMGDADYKGRPPVRNFSSPSVSLLGPRSEDQAAAACTPDATL